MTASRRALLDGGLALDTLATPYGRLALFRLVAAMVLWTVGPWALRQPAGRGLALAGLVIAINLLGDWLRDALNPKLQ